MEQIDLTDCRILSFVFGMGVKTLLFIQHYDGKHNVQCCSYDYISECCDYYYLL